MHLKLAGLIVVLTGLVACGPQVSAPVCHEVSALSLFAEFEPNCAYVADVVARAQADLQRAGVVDSGEWHKIFGGTAVEIREEAVWMFQSGDEDVKIDGFYHGDWNVVHTNRQLRSLLHELLHRVADYENFDEGPDAHENWPTDWWWLDQTYSLQTYELNEAGQSN